MPQFKVSDIGFAILIVALDLLVLRRAIIERESVLRAYPETFPWAGYGL